MSLLDNAFQAEAILLQVDDGAEILIFGGTDEPQTIEPDAPVGSFYFRSNGEVYQKATVGTQFSNWAENDPGSGVGVTGTVPFFNANGSQDNIDLSIGNELPFFNADGSPDNIALV